MSARREIMIKGRRGTIRTLIATTLCSTALLLALASTASAAVQCGATCSAWWHVDTQLLPAALAPGGQGQISILAENLGDAGLNGATPVVVRDKLPQGLTAQSIDLILPTLVGNFGPFFCEIVSGEAVCTLPGGEFAETALRPYSFVSMTINVSV